MAEFFVTDYPDAPPFSGAEYYKLCMASWRNGSKPWPGNYRERGRVGRLVRPERDPRWPADGRGIEQIFVDESKNLKL